MIHVSDDMLSLNLRDAREQFEREYLRRLRDRHGTALKAAKAAGMERTAFHRKCANLGLTF